MISDFKGQDYYLIRHMKWDKPVKYPEFPGITDRETCLRAIDILRSGKMDLTVGDIHPTAGVHNSIMNEFNKKYREVKRIYVV